jgi:hypothetical protein
LILPLIFILPLILILPLGGAAVYRCDNHRVLSAGFSRWGKRRPN